MQQTPTKKTFTEKKIFYARLELIKDFLFLLLDKMDKTYLGDSLMSVETQKEHFEYCLNYTIEIFNFRSIKIQKTLPFKNYLFKVFFSSYYELPKSKANFEKFKMIINQSLSYSSTKSQQELDAVLEYHMRFDEILGNLKNS